MEGPAFPDGDEYDPSEKQVRIYLGYRGTKRQI
jgi:hypothetical protein